MPAAAIHCFANYRSLPLFFSATIGGFGERASWFGAEVGSAIDAEVANPLSLSIKAAAEGLLAVVNANLGAAAFSSRSRERVERDVQLSYVSAAAAKDSYGQRLR
jgi:hypothetical protein